MPHFLEDELSIPMIKANLIFESRLPGRNAQIGMCSCLKDIWFFVCRRCPNYNYIHVIIYPCVVLQVFFGITCHWCNHLKMSHLLRKLQLVLQMRKEQLQRLQRHLPQKWCLEKMWRRWRCGFGLMFFLLSLFLFVWGGPKDVAFLKVFFCVVFVLLSLWFVCWGGNTTMNSDLFYEDVWFVCISTCFWFGFGKFRFNQSWFGRSSWLLHALLHALFCIHQACNACFPCRIAAFKSALF